MKNIIMKAISIIMMCIFTSTVFGCTSKNNKISETRYSEEQINIPELTNVYDVKLFENQISLIGSDSNNTLVDTYNSDKDTWIYSPINIHYEGKITDDDATLQALSNDKSIEKYAPIDATVSDEGNMAYIDYEKAKGKDNINHNIYTTDRKTIAIDINKEILDSLGDINYLNSKDLFAISEKDIYQYNGETGKLKFQYHIETGSILSQCYIDNNLYVVTTSGFEKYDTNTGKKVEDIDSLREYVDSNTKIFKGIGTKILIRNSKGLFRYKTNDGTIEKIIDGSYTLLGDSQLDVVSILEYNKTNTNSKYEYMVLYKDNSNNKFSLYKYKYSEKLSNKELTEISIYSLYENESIKQFARKYQNDKDDIKINYEFGIGTYGGLTEDDALKKLNTEIMAGKGPDILLLDGMNSEYYEEKGILENLDDIVEENKEDLFSNIIDSFYKGNKIYLIPINIKIPMIMGKKDVVSDGEDIKSLANSIEDNLKNQDISIMKIYNPEDIINLMYFTSSKDFIDGKDLNEESVKSFLENTKKIYDISKNKTNKDEYKLYNESSNKYKEQYGDGELFSKNIFLTKSIGPNDFVKKDITNVDLGYVSSLADVSRVLGTVNNRDDISYKYFSGNGEKLFLPGNVVAVNSKSKNKKMAKEIVSDILKNEYFNSDTEGIFTTNKKLLENSFQINKDKGIGSIGIGNEDGEVLIPIKWLDNENYNYIIDTINSLEGSIDTNTIALDPILDYGKKYILGDMSIDETLNKISKDLNIKLEE